MPQKGQITRHEWEPLRYSDWVRKCIHCKVIRFLRLDGTVVYMKDGEALPDKPKCIPRKKPEDGTHAH